MKRNNFTFFKEYWIAIDGLSLAQQKDLVWAMAQLGSGGKFEEIIQKIPTKSAQNLLLSYRFSLEKSKKLASNGRKKVDISTSEKKQNEIKSVTSRSRSRSRSRNRNRSNISYEILENTAPNFDEKKPDWSSVDCFGGKEFKPMIGKICEDYQVPESFVWSKIDDMKNKRDLCEKKYKYKNYYLALRSWVKKDVLEIKNNQRKEQSGKSTIAYGEI